MFNSEEEILANIDATLDQLIENSLVLNPEESSLMDYEIEALQKTQESLLAHVVHMQKHLHEPRKISQKREMIQSRIGKKISEFGRLNQRLVKQVSKNFAKTNRKKKNLV